jgi:transposase-like protein
MAVPRPSIPDSEVPAKPKRRRFTADYKRSIVEQADAGQDAGAIGALLRREGLYSSHLSTWRRQRRAGELAALAPKRRGRKTILNPLVLENRKLVAANARLCPPGGNIVAISASGTPGTLSSRLLKNSKPTRFGRG